VYYKRQNVLGNFLIFNKLYLRHIKGKAEQKSYIFMSFLYVFDNA